jgi:hypothetical protein
MQENVTTSHGLIQNNFQDYSWVMEQVLGYKWLSECHNKRFEDGV